MELKIPPPIVFLCCAILIYALPNLAEINPLKWFAIPFGILATIVDIAALALFLQKKTTINPLAPSKTQKLVTNGIYRFTRNPMYVGLLCWLIAWGLWLGNTFAFLVIWGFMVYITRFQIIPEEKILEQKFSTEYLNYKQKVARWLW
ncbi:protein-S-isoprenylcysteine methyltransferase [Pasteurellaceae bacterium LFhippo2]|nr:protein-S-isoprenylcysteine methyltransferase [Pasteurellaceae bacterium LFhippo2]